VREALFSILGQDLCGQRFLDAFGGAGLMGLEAWSRGASVTVVERNRKAFVDIIERGRTMGAEWQVLKGDVLSLVGQLDPFDMVFADPPYPLEIGPILCALAPVARTCLVAEVRSTTVVPNTVGMLQLAVRKEYGGTSLAIYRQDD